MPWIRITYQCRTASHSQTTGCWYRKQKGQSDACTAYLCQQQCQCIHQGLGRQRTGQVWYSRWKVIRSARHWSLITITTQMCSARRTIMRQYHNADAKIASSWNWTVLNRVWHWLIYLNRLITWFVVPRMTCSVACVSTASSLRGTSSMSLP